MKNILGIILLLNLFTIGLSQDEEQSPIKYIIIDSTKAKISNFKKIVKPGSDFYRKKKLIRLDLTFPGNEPLLHATQKGHKHDGGIVSLIIQGLETQKLVGRHPSNLHKSFDYYDLIYHLMDLEGIEPDPMGDSIRISDLGWEWMMESIDLIGDEGVSNSHSRKFFRINYIRLIWENPLTAQGKRIITVIPYDQSLRSFLENVICPVENGPSINAKEFLELRQFKGRKTNISEDSAQPIDSQMNRDRNTIFKIEEIWHH